MNEYEQYIPTNEIITAMYKFIETNFEDQTITDRESFENEVIFKYCLKEEPDSRRAKKLKMVPWPNDFKDKAAYANYDPKSLLSPKEFWLVFTTVKIVLTNPLMRDKANQIVYWKTASAYSRWVLLNVLYHKYITGIFPNVSINEKYCKYCEFIKTLRKTSYNAKGLSEEPVYVSNEAKESKEKLADILSDEDVPSELEAYKQHAHAILYHNEELSPLREWAKKYSIPFKEFAYQIAEDIYNNVYECIMYEDADLTSFFLQLVCGLKKKDVSEPTTVRDLEKLGWED